MPKIHEPYRLLWHTIMKKQITFESGENVLLDGLYIVQLVKIGQIMSTIKDDFTERIVFNTRFKKLKKAK